MNAVLRSEEREKYSHNSNVLVIPLPCSQQFLEKFSILMCAVSVCEHARMRGPTKFINSRQDTETWRQRERRVGRTRTQNTCHNRRWITLTTRISVSIANKNNENTLATTKSNFELTSHGGDTMRVYDTYRVDSNFAWTLINVLRSRHPLIYKYIQLLSTCKYQSALGSNSFNSVMGNRKIYYLRGTCEHTTVRLNEYLDFLNSLCRMRWAVLLNARARYMHSYPFIELAGRFESRQTWKEKNRGTSFMSWKLKHRLMTCGNMLKCMRYCACIVSISIDACHPE